jgi:hypothetical protein
MKVEHPERNTIPAAKIMAKILVFTGAVVR